MISEFKNCKFKYVFRNYQKRVMDELDKHLDDEKINVIAAPGAGKTILALSLMIKLGEPALIVAPTILLRQQWLDRLKNDFEGFNNIEKYISEDIYNPNLITITTYQSIYSVYKGKSKKNEGFDIVKELKKLNIKTVILDEAHHLKLSWLDATKSLIEKLNGIKVISLTATPPYDVEKTLWNRYIGLCGEPDIEIPVPELVNTGDLAPHQDYIFFNCLTDSQIGEISEYNKRVMNFFEKYARNVELITAISMHEGIISLDRKLDYFIDNFEYYDAMISFLIFNDVDIPVTSQYKFSYVKNGFDIKKMQVLLTYCLYNDRKSYAAFESIFRKIKKDLNEIGAIYESKVNLVYTNEVRKTLSQNIGKLNSVKDILEIEKNQLRTKLKAVVITENIYKELLTEVEAYDTKYIGVVPIFRYLSQNTNLEYTVLTGEIIVIPTKYSDKLIEISKEFNIDDKDIEINEMGFDFEYSTVSFSGNASKNRVLIITKLFEMTSIEVLIGTNALIGEGWDAPFINTLIMATPVSAYVSANQIRGRVIRKHKKEPDKFANIWHLVCVEKGKDKFYLGYDYDNLIKRFDSFEGIDVDGQEIRYGIGRLGLPVISSKSIDNLDTLNNKFIEYAKKRNETCLSWRKALKTYKPIRKNNASNLECIECVENSENNEKKMLNLLKHPRNKILKVIDATVGFLGCHGVLFKLSTYALADAGILAVGTGLTILATNLLVKNLVWTKNSKEKIAHKFIESIYVTLKRIGELSTDSKLIIKDTHDGLVYFIENSTLKENEILKTSVNEMFSKLDNARYVIKLDKMYISVPSIIGRKKEFVKIFADILSSKAKIIYLKSEEGKKILFNIKLTQNKLVSTIEKNENYKKEDESSIKENIINVDIMKDNI